jgi:hypothetical protein
MPGRILPAVLILWAIVPMLSRQAGAGERRNLITNGGFEEGLAGWTPAAGHSLATGAGVAHSGQACLTGEVTGPKQALILRRTVVVKGGNQYDFQIAARATGGTKLVLWAVYPGQKERTMVAGWDKLTPKWQELTVRLAPQQDGPLELQIVAPSSHGAPAGRIWIDDIALVEQTFPANVSVTHDQGFNDEPALARTADGSLYVAWISFRDGADTLQVARYQPQEKGFKRLGNWQIAGGKGSYLLGVKAVSAGDRVAVVYAAEQNRIWDIYTVWCGTEGPGKPINISQDAALDLNPSAAWQAGTLWLAWESNRDGVHRVMLTSVRDGQIAPAEPVSRPDANAYDPSLAVLQSGVVCVGWHSFIDDNYDIYLRRRAPAGKWDTELRLTRAPTIDRHVALAARGDELWVAYENAQVVRYHVGATNFRRLIVGRLEGDKLLVPKNYRRAPLYGRCESPNLALDAAGRLWLAYLRPRLPRAGWDCWLTCYDGSCWQDPQPVGIQKGMDRQPGFVLDGDRATVAFQADDMPNSWSDVDNTAGSKSNIFLAGLDLGSTEKATAMQLEPLSEPNDEFEAAQLHVARGEHLATPSIEYQGKSLKLFFGDLHHHSDISICNRCGDQSVEEGYQHMRDINRLDFACATDHCYNLNAYLWSYLGKLARVNEQPDHFLTFLAEEWTSSFKEENAEHPYGFYGHRNLIFADPYFPRWWNSRNRQNPAQVWEELRKMNADFIHIPHQLADTGNVPTDWNYTDPQAQPVAEIFQTRGSYEYHGTPRQAPGTTPPGYFIQDAWARGIVIGVIAAPDHGGGYGKACVFAPELTRTAILEALRNRRCYGTTAAKIFLDVRVNDHLMGEALPTRSAGPVTVKIRATCPADIDRVEICRNNRFLYVNHPEGKTCELTFVDRDPLPQRSYYYVRVIQKDEEIAWSSPVWFEK